jgi:hypothetical protein
MTLLFWRKRRARSGPSPESVERIAEAHEVIRRLRKHREENHFGEAFMLAFNVHQEGRR